MKNSVIAIPLVVFGLFVSFLLGIFVERNLCCDPVETSRFFVDAPALADVTPPATEQTDFPVNINTADLDTLASLPGIELILGQRIIDYREQNGPYKHKEDLLRIHRLGPKTLELLYDYSTLGG